MSVYSLSSFHFFLEVKYLLVKFWQEFIAKHKTINRIKLTLGFLLKILSIISIYSNPSSYIMFTSFQPVLNL